MAKWPSPWNEKLALETMHLSPAELGAYCRMMLCACQSRDRTLPNDDTYLARITGTGKAWPSVKPAVMAFWKVGEDGKLNDVRLSRRKSLSDALKTKTSEFHSDFILTSKRRHSGRPGRVDPLAGDIQKAFEAWNEMALRLGLIDVASRLTDARQPRLRMRLKEYGLDGWMKVLAKIEANPFLRGEVCRPGWKGAHIDFILQAESFTKIIEDKYDDKRNGRPTTSYRNGFYGGGPSIGDFFESPMGGGTAPQAGDAGPHSRGEIVIEASRSSDNAGG